MAKPILTWGDANIHVSWNIVQHLTCRRALPAVKVMEMYFVETFSKTQQPGSSILLFCGGVHGVIKSKNKQEKNKTSQGDYKYNVPSFITGFTLYKQPAMRQDS